ncbi:MAG: hypothetical protein PF505_03265 [Vallitaleaceae bacterium]|jgi:hypothetical protein|nr:hypothetical protein [Vallitaleaceae bacterium]
MKKEHIIIANLDLIYIIFVAIVITCDFIFKSDVLIAIIYLLILAGFALSLIPKNKDGKDERLIFIKHTAGYSAFLLGALVLMIFSLVTEIFDVEFSSADLLRTISMCMFFVFTIINAIGKRLI